MRQLLPSPVNPVWLHASHTPAGRPSTQVGPGPGIGVLPCADARRVTFSPQPFDGERAVASETASSSAPMPATETRHSAAVERTATNGELAPSTLILSFCDATIVASGSLTGETCDLLLASVDWLVGRGHSQIVFDLRQLAGADWVGVRRLFDGRSDIEARGIAVEVKVAPDLRPRFAAFFVRAGTRRLSPSDEPSRDRRSADARVSGGGAPH
jgi:anti-anti-sigma regulatory factor